MGFRVPFVCLRPASSFLVSFLLSPPIIPLSPPPQMILSLFLVMLLPPSSSASNSTPLSKFMLDPSKLDLLLRRAALMALLKAKAKSTLREVSMVDRVMFSQCLEERNQQGKNPVGLAKCVTKILEARDRMRRERRSRKRRRRKKNLEEKVTVMRNLLRGWKRREVQKRERMKKKEKDEEEEKQIERRIMRRKKDVREEDEREGIGRRKKRVIMLKETKKDEEERKWVARRRKRRTRRGEQLPPQLGIGANLRNLRTLEHYSHVLDHYRRFIERMQSQNSELLSKFDSSAKVHFASPADFPADHHIDPISPPSSSDRISVLSPRFFSLFPRSSSSDHQLLSPDLFSFHNSNLASFPAILKMANLGKRESAAWLDLLLNITGSGPMLAKLVASLDPAVNQIERELMPAMESIERAERAWKRLGETMDAEQRRAAERKGYAHLKEWQRHILFPDAETTGGRHSESETEAERGLEMRIAELARMGDELHFFTVEENTAGPPFRQELTRRRRRQAPTQEAGRQPIPRTVLLDPFGFDTRTGGVVLEGIYLSPTFFYNELTSPEVLTIRVLSPIAFYTTILSPGTLFARVLSPEVFRVQVLTPQALDAYILSPEAFMVEVLSPVGAEARVLAPRGMFVQILGPIVGSLYMGSSDMYGLLILSPHILSPHFHSEDRYMIEVLSPHILSVEYPPGDERDDHEHLGGTVVLNGWPGTSPLETIDKSEKHRDSPQ